MRRVLPLLILAPLLLGSCALAKSTSTAPPPVVINDGKRTITVTVMVPAPKKSILNGAATILAALIPFLPL
jgi:hypothetical protein